MQIILAKTAGFCFGVNRAVKLTYELLEQGRPVATLGPLIHNPQVVEDLESKGAITCDSVDDVPDGCEVVIRSHGVGQSVYDKISTRRLAYHDATCPFVTKIHKIAARAGAEGAMLLVAGDAKHPEVQGIVGHTTGKVEVFANLAELEKLLPELTQQKSIFAVAQTTFNVQSWETCKEFLKNQCTNAKFLIQYVMQRGRGNRKRKTSAKNAIIWSSLVVIILPIPKSCCRSRPGIPKLSMWRQLMNSTKIGLTVPGSWA